MPNTSETSRLMDQAAESFLKPFTTQKEYIYVDSDLLYDYPLGFLMMQVRDQKQYDYVLSRLDDYSTFSSRDITKCFPELGVTREQYEASLKDANCQKYAAVLAPRTGFLMDLAGTILAINTYNKDKETTRPIKLYVNQRTTLLPPKFRKDLFGYLRKIDPRIQIIYTDYQSWNEVPTELIKKLDFIGVGDMVDFLKQGSNMQKVLLEPGSMMSAVVFAYPTCEDDDYESENDRKEALVNFSHVMQVMFGQFIYVKRLIPHEKR